MRDVPKLSSLRIDVEKMAELRAQARKIHGSFPPVYVPAGGDLADYIPDVTDAEILASYRGEPVAEDHAVVKVRTWEREGFVVIARIMADGQHEVAIVGTVTMPLYYPGDAYDLDGNPVAFPRYHGRMLVKEMMDDAYYWIGENAPQPPMPRSMTR